MNKLGNGLAGLAALGLIAAAPAAAQTRPADSLPPDGVARCVDSARVMRTASGESLGPAPSDTTLPACARGVATGRGLGGGLSPALLVGVTALVALALAVGGGGGGNGNGGGGNDSPG